MKLVVNSLNPVLPAPTRWANANDTYGHANPQRAREVADKIIAHGIESVLDIGCGNMRLGALLRAVGIGYTPADVVQRSEDCLVVDLNQDEIPCCPAECAVMIGVLEFLENPARAIEDISRKYKRILITLSPLQTIYEQVWYRKPHSIACTHTSAFSLTEFKRLFSNFFVIDDIDVITSGQYILFGTSKNWPAPSAIDRAPAPVAAPAGIEGNVINFDGLSPGFEAHILKSVPFHNVFLRTATLLASTVVRPGTVCVDFGCSTGRLPRLLRRQFTGSAPVEIVAIDHSPEMIERARRHDASPLTKYLCEDILNYAVPASTIFISCLFTLQFLEIDARQEMLAKMYQGLDPRGYAVIAEKVLESDGKRQMTNHYLLNAYKRSMGLSDGEVLAKERAVRAALRPLSQEENLQMFAQAGFKKVQVVLSVFGWELYLLEKQ